MLLDSCFSFLLQTKRAACLERKTLKKDQMVPTTINLILNSYY